MLSESNKVESSGLESRSPELMTISEKEEEYSDDISET
jgi:hypothetical protein